MRYLHLIRVFITGSIQGETAYRFNFAANLLNTVLGLAGSAGGLAVVFFRNETLNGWNVREATALLGVYLLILGLKDIVIGPGLESLSGLSGELWTGLFDYTLLKPLPIQFYISFRKWSVWSVINISIAAAIIAISGLGGFGMQAVSAQAAPVQTAGPFLLFLFTILISLVLIYSILLILASAAFWYLGTPLMWIFDGLIQTGRFPVGIYPKFFRILLTWVIPVGFIVTVPAQVFLGGANIVQVVGGAALAVFLFLLSSVLFKLSIRKYASASS